MAKPSDVSSDALLMPPDPHSIALTPEELHGNVQSPTMLGGYASPTSASRFDLGDRRLRAAQAVRREQSECGPNLRVLPSHAAAAASAGRDSPSFGNRASAGRSRERTHPGLHARHQPRKR